MSTLEIVSAWYGTEKDVVGADVTAVVKDILSTGSERVTVMNDDMKVDPVLGEIKTLWVTYSLDGGETKKTFSKEEYNAIFLSDLA